MHRGYIKLYRKILEWEWYADLPVRTLFFHLLLKANHSDKKWKGIFIKKGDVLTGRNKLAEQTGLTVQQVRSALTKLKSTNEITIKPTNRNSLITLINYKLYQPTTSKPHNKQPTDNQQITTTKKEKNVKEVYGEFKNVSLSLKEFSKLKDNYGAPGVDDMVERLDRYVESTGKKYKSHYATMLNWFAKEKGDKPKIKQDLNKLYNKI
ncbi:hypothetical protein LCGC14_1098180 [marine sediment metagenome]|uniref:Bacteriophage lambda Replication protein O N-terminal domain-containing protein n=1 Tax=marine sediment metagenome TaxID=412755 RepID=A0A0F9PTJ4_9ZZZZ|nr:hypothetical protein [bacterium]